MKKMTLLFLLVIGAMISFAANRTGFIKTGQTVLSVPMTFGTTDTLGTDETVTIIVTSEQVNPSKQNMYTTLTTVSGSPSVAIKLYGKCFAGDTYVQIGSTQTWTSASNNPVNISATTPNQYRYFKAEYVCSGATQEVKITAFELKLWLTSGLASSGTLTDGTMTANSGALAGVTTIAASGRITGTGGATLTGAATNINASSNFATNIGTGTTDAAVSIGGGSNTVAVNSTSWDISTAGAVSGVTTLAASGAITATGGVAFATGSTVFWAKGGTPLAAATGTDTAPSAGARYWVELDIPYNATLTGLSYLVGSVGGTDSVMVNLFNGAGTLVATSKKTGAAHGNIVGTAAEIQSVPFTATYAAVAGKYFASVQFNGTTARFRTYLVPGSKYVASTAAGTYDTAAASITPGSTWTVSQGPIVATY